MTYEDIIVETNPSGISRITLNRPERLNAHTLRMATELADAIGAFWRDDAQRVLILTGAGKGFCAGGDIRSEVEWEIGEQRQFGHATVMREGFHHLVRTIRQVDKPIIGQINGAAVAGGLALALLCDIRVASENAKFGDPSGNIAMLPDEGGAWLFPRAMGMEAAMRMTLLGEVYDAKRAKELGLVGEVVPHDQLADRVDELAARLAQRAPLALRLAKRMISRAAEATLEQTLADSELAVTLTNTSEDFAEGLDAFLQGRPPQFRGR